MKFLCRYPLFLFRCFGSRNFERLREPGQTAGPLDRSPDSAVEQARSAVRQHHRSYDAIGSGLPVQCKPYLGEVRREQREEDWELWPYYWGPYGPWGTVPVGIAHEDAVFAKRTKRETQRT